MIPANHSPRPTKSLAISAVPEDGILQQRHSLSLLTFAPVLHQILPSSWTTRRTTSTAKRAATRAAAEAETLAGVTGDCGGAFCFGALHDRRGRTGRAAAGHFGRGLHPARRARLCSSSCRSVR